MKPIVSPNIRVRHPEHFHVEEDSIVDDYCYFSTRVRIGRCSHVASGCTVAGGGEHLFQMGAYSSLSAGVRIWCTSDDFVNDIVTILPNGIGPVKTHLITGDVVIADYTAVGSNAVVMPANHIPEGTVIGALSFVPAAFKLEAWSVYAGVPVRYIRPRNKENVMLQVDRLNRFFDGRAAHGKED
jgi:acetyltransferase-like isoleucine patch superfamily enzyme